MKIFRRHFSALELLVFASAYILGNYLVIRMNRTWSNQEKALAYKQGERHHHFRHHQGKSDGMGQDHPHPAPQPPPARPGLTQSEPDYDEPAGETLLYDDRHGNLGSRNDPGRHKPKVPSGWGALLAAGSLVEEVENHQIMHQTETEAIRTGLELNTKSPMVTTEESFQQDDLIEDEQPIDEGSHEGADMKTILFWNTFFESADFRFGYGQAPFFEWKCPVYNCRTTGDKSQLEKADALMFHGPRIDTFPVWRSPEQVYIYLQQEPHESLSDELLQSYHNKFNLTITHRKMSDIHIPYARIFQRPDKARHHKKVSFETKKKNIVWVVSHCHTSGKREWYVKELIKHIDIDIYGGCGEFECPKDDVWGCFDKFEKEYKFYLSFENNFCDDYVSEKLYRPLEYNIVPITFGGANYSEAAPPNAVIDMRDYPNPKDLARFLKNVGSNEKAYNRFFQWKSQGYEIDTGRKPIMGEAFCKLCEILHDPDYPYRSEEYRDIKKWWVDGMCDPYFVSKLRKQYKW